MTPITSAQAGSLVNIAFHVVPGAQASATGVQLVDSVTPHGQSFGTVLADSRAAMVLSPGLDHLGVMTGLVPQVVSSAIQQRGDVGGDRPVDGRWSDDRIRDGVETAYLTASADQGAAAPLAVLSNGSVVGETAAHAVPANLVVTGALAFQTTAVAATEFNWPMDWSDETLLAPQTAARDQQIDGSLVYVAALIASSPRWATIATFDKSRARSKRVSPHNLVTRLCLVTHCVAGSACTKFAQRANTRATVVGRRGGAWSRETAYCVRGSLNVGQSPDACH